MTPKTELKTTVPKVELTRAQKAELRQLSRDKMARDKQFKRAKKGHVTARRRPHSDNYFKGHIYESKNLQQQKTPCYCLVTVSGFRLLHNNS